MAYGVLGNGCTRIGEIKQRREGTTFFINIETIYDQPAGTGCTLAVSEFREEVIFDVRGFGGGDYTVAVNGVTAMFSLPVEDHGEGHETVEATIESVDVVLRESYPVQIDVYIESYYGGCTTFSSVSQRLEEQTFFIRVLVSAPMASDGPTCPPTEYPFTERVRLETADLEPGT